MRALRSSFHSNNVPRASGGSVLSRSGITAMCSSITLDVSSNVAQRRSGAEDHRQRNDRNDDA